MCGGCLHFYVLIAMCTYDMVVIKMGRDLTNLLITTDFTPAPVAARSKA